MRYGYLCRPWAESTDRLTFSELLLDIPAHTYQATFEPNKAWSQFYASAKEIHQYWKGVVQKYGCMRYIKLKQRTVEAVWDEDNSKWNLKVSTLERPITEWKAADELGTGPKCRQWLHIPRYMRCVDFGDGCFERVEMAQYPWSSRFQRKVTAQRWLG